MAKRPNRRWQASARKADSLWEANLRDGPFSEHQYHPEKVEYTIAHKYEPDFQSGNILIEAKGRFRESSEASKYIHVRKFLKEGQELVFLFYKAANPMPNAKPRKDGTKQTHADWADKNKFTWFENPVALNAYIARCNAENVIPE